jgi:D-alanyl-D-alanine carboxypeptidase/D-alanyl-D-alanine-endopeptidase (penicillin-binding protein 4)
MKPLVAASLLLLGGCASLSPPRSTPDPLTRLRSEIDAVLSDSLLVPTRTGIKIVSLNSGRVLYDRDSELLMHPASNLKLITTATTLKALGNNFLFKTTILADSTTPDGIVRGNVYLKGYGDPDLTVTDLDSMASNVRSQGIRRIEGDVVADVSYFDDLYWGNGWMWDDEPDPDEMFISPLSVNKNFVTVTVLPTFRPGDSAIVAINPPTPYIGVVNSARTVEDSVTTNLHISRLFKERLNIITVTGGIAVHAAPFQRRISVWKPELFAAELFKESLERQGVFILGQVRIGVAPSIAHQVVQRSRPVDSVIIAMNKVSDNLSAENLLKTIGAERRGIPGSARNGMYVVNEYLSSLGIDTTALYLVDGSGVSHYNLLSADQIMKVLIGIARDRVLGPIVYASLPIAGVDGTLQSRMVGMAAQGNLRAKTGTIGGVSSLSGYVRASDGEMLAFSMVMENYVVPTRMIRRVQDTIGEILARYSRKPVAEGSREQ